MGNGNNISSDLPKGYQILEKRLLVAGIQHYSDAALKFIHNSDQHLELEKEENNKFDPNAIKIIGVSKGWFFNSRNHIGYVPKEISKQINATELFEMVKPRVTRTYEDDNDFIEIQFQIIGPKDKKTQYDGFLKNKPANQIQKEFYKYFSYKTPKCLTTGEADEFIKKNIKKLKSDDSEKLQNWDNYEEILDEFNDSDFRETYEIKKPSISLLRDAIARLIENGETMQSLSDDIEIIVDKVILLKPDIVRK